MRGITESNNNGSPTSPDAHPMNDYKAKIEAILVGLSTNTGDEYHKLHSGKQDFGKTNARMKYYEGEATASLLQLLTEARIEELNMVDYGYHNMLESPNGIRELFHHIQSRLAELKDNQK